MASPHTVVAGLPGEERLQLLDRLWEIQQRDGAIGDAAVAGLARWLGLSPLEIDEVASFYHFFHRGAPARHRVYLIDSALARLSGHDRIREALERAAGCRLGEVDAGGRIGLHSTPCAGLSDLEPAMLVDGIPFCRLTPERVASILARLLAGEPAAVIAAGDDAADPATAAWIERVAPVTLRRTGPLFFTDHRDHQRLLRECLERSPEELVALVTDAGLRGRGGAGFPTGLKWRLTREQPGAPKYLVCNADEGEPGTFKDRALLSRAPLDVFAGMVVAARATGADRGILYLRAEYRYLRPWLERQLQALRDQGLLGDAILGLEGFDFDIRVQLGAGAYVCGDETALIESCEGRRGTPRLKPPFPIQHGILGHPTCVNNVETFAAVSAIAAQGPERFRALGTAESAGTRLLSVSGDCGRPGIYEIEWGATLEQVLAMVGARDPGAVWVSGPSGECVSPQRDGGRRFCYGDLSCNGSLMLFRRDRDLLSLVRHFTAFFAAESCGICVPCRTGNVNLLQRLDRVIAGRGSERDLADLAAWGELMGRASRCGLGATAPRPILTTLERFPERYRERLAPADDVLLPGFDPAAALAGGDPGEGTA